MNDTRYEKLKQQQRSSHCLRTIHMAGGVRLWGERYNGYAETMQDNWYAEVMRVAKTMQDNWYAEVMRVTKTMRDNWYAEVMRVTMGVFMLHFFWPESGICYAFSLKHGCVLAHFCRITENGDRDRKKITKRCVYNL